MGNESQQAVWWLPCQPFPGPSQALRLVVALGVCSFLGGDGGRGIKVLSAEPGLGRAAPWQLLRAPSWDQGTCPELQGRLYLAWLFLRNRVTGEMKSIRPPPRAAHSWSWVGHAAGSSKTGMERMCLGLGTLQLPPLRSPLSFLSISQVFYNAFS